MLIGRWTAAALVAALLFPTGSVLAADQDRTRQQEQIYGSQLMTAEERTEHRKRMRAAKTEAEREKIRQENHKRMKQRAKEKGVTLPDKPSTRGGGNGYGRDGMGRGGGRGR